VVRVRVRGNKGWFMQKVKRNFTVEKSIISNWYVGKTQLRMTDELQFLMRYFEEGKKKLIWLASS
jgi:hypothetical protein